MAQITRVNGDLQPVVVVDQPVAASSPGAGFSSGINTVVSGATVNPAGPKLDFGTVTFTGNATVSGTSLAIAIQTIQQNATIAIYEFTTNSSNTATLALATFPTGAWNFADTGDLDVALTAALGYAVSTAASATFTN
jgi:hypothetical protein